MAEAAGRVFRVHRPLLRFLTDTEQVRRRMQMTDGVMAWIDGAARGNPGPSGIGVRIEDENGKRLKEFSEYIGDNLTNNQAEYHALLKALKECEDMGFGEVEVRSDSQLLVRQMKGDYRVLSDNIKDLYDRAKNIESSFDKVSYVHVNREDNTNADALANKAIEIEIG